MLQDITNVLSLHRIPYKFLESTNDIWVRDFMPIQLDRETFVQFRYHPRYLKDDLDSQSDPHEVCKKNNLQPTFSNINLDGGNVVGWSNRAIVTDRVFEDNPEYRNKSKLLADIESLLEAEVIVIPQIRGDMTGHADGMVRFLNDHTVLGNDRNVEYKYWSKAVTKILAEHQIDYIDIPFFEYKDRFFPDNAIGCYINYLEVANLIVIPRFDVAGNRDEEAFESFEKLFPDRSIESVNINEIGKEGGLLNCITWTIEE